jgi:hypothetical protein
MKNLRTWTYILIIFIISTLSSCNPTPEPLPPTIEPTPSFDNVQPITLVTFKVHLPESVSQASEIYLSILDEVTGLAVNPENHLMQSVDANTYTVSFPFLLGSVIKYRYILSETTQLQEHLSDGSPVRYRMYYVSGPGVVSDYVAQWRENPTTIPIGRIFGFVNDNKSGRGIPDIQISIAGDRTLTRSDGSFFIEGLPQGTHNLVAYALDGSYSIFQQEATIASDSSTEAKVVIEPAQFVNVSFDLVVPENTPQDMPVRIAGNLQQLGNTFADLSGGVSAIASLMPILSLQSDNHYIFSMQLPVGSDIRYKYTLGDGFLNSERNQEGQFILRQLTVPPKDIEIKDEVFSWQEGDDLPIHFNVTVPPTTPPEEVISIQYDLGFGWLHPLPMRRTLENPESSTWTFVLFDPIPSGNQLYYRYCRQDQCGVADDSMTSGNSIIGRSVQQSSTPQNIQDRIDSWIWLESGVGPATVPNVVVTPRGSDFVAGIALLPSHHPSWIPAYPTAIADISALNANFCSSRRRTVIRKPVFGMLLGDLLYTVIQINRAGNPIADACRFISTPWC